MTGTKRVFAHRYLYRHDKRRKQLRKLAQAGEIQIVERSRDGWLYEVPGDLKIK